MPNATITKKNSTLFISVKDNIVYHVSLILFANEY